jgi:hypothetical protein
MHYIDLITLFYKERKITSTNIDTINMPEFDIVLYIENILDAEMIFYEFCELVFFICRKYFQFNGIVLEEEEQKMKNKFDPESRKNKKKTRRFKKEDEDNTNGSNINRAKSAKSMQQLEEKIKSEDYYLKVINEILKTKNEFIKKNDIYEVDKYFYPKLKTHIIIENLMEQERLRKLEEERKERDRIRYNLERKAFKDEDINVHKEDKEEKSDSEDNSEY